MVFSEESPMSEAYGDSMDPAIARSLERAMKVREGVIEDAVNLDVNLNPEVCATNLISIQGQKDNCIEDCESHHGPEHPPADVEIEDGEVMISTINCGIICKPKNIGMESSFIVLYLSKEERSRFVLYPGTRFVIYTNTMNGTSGKFDVFYSGINFEYDDSVFTVFHTIKEE